MRTLLAASFLTLAMAAGEANAQVRIGGGIHIDFGFGHRHHRRVESPIYCPPRPVVHRTWVPGCWETVCEQVWVPGECRRVWVPPEYREVVDSCGNVRRTCVRRGYYHNEQLPGHYETRTRRVWREGHWR